MSAAANDSSKPRRLLRIDEVVERVGLSKSSIYGRIRAMAFPAPVNLGGHSVAWVESEIEEWIAARITERDKAA